MGKRNSGALAPGTAEWCTCVPVLVVGATGTVEVLSQLESWTARRWRRARTRALLTAVAGSATQRGESLMSSSATQRATPSG
jgi:hypothetical protein